jgi:uncharacterized peroxidase-related enzyme
LSHHGAGLLRLTKNQGLVDALSRGEDANELTSAERAMLSYARKLTTALGSVTEEDIQALQNEGFNDRAILEINLAVSYMNFVNRIAEGLGVELETALAPFTR